LSSPVTAKHRWLVFLGQDPDKVNAFSSGEGLGDCAEQRSRRRREKLAERQEHIALRTATTWINNLNHPGCWQPPTADAFAWIAGALNHLFVL
jgi:hypothetical protein